MQGHPIFKQLQFKLLQVSLLCENILEVEHEAKKRFKGSRGKIITRILEAQFLSQHTNVIVSKNGGEYHMLKTITLVPQVGFQKYFDARSSSLRENEDAVGMKAGLAPPYPVVAPDGVEGSMEFL